jgi:hypothetical protein
MGHFIDGKLVNIIGYEPFVGDPVIIKGRIQEIYQGQRSSRSRTRSKDLYL